MLGETAATRERSGPRIAIIGGGAAGLILAAAITRYAADETDASVTVFEASMRWGGLWRPDRYNDRTAPVPAYPFLRTNLPTCLTDSPLLPWREFRATSVEEAREEPGGQAEKGGPADAAGSFPSRDEIARYLDAIRQRYLEPNPRVSLQLGTRVLRCYPSAGGGVTLSVGRSIAEHDFAFDHCVVCVGRFAVPRMPQGDLSRWLGDRSDVVDVAHVAAIDWATFAVDRRRVLLVGAGSSARDLLVWLLGHGAARVHWVSRGIHRRYGQTVATNMCTPSWRGRVSISETIDAVDPNDVDVVVCATGYDEAMHAASAIEIAASDEDSYDHRGIHVFGREGTVAPLAMLYHEAREWVDRHLLLLRAPPLPPASSNRHAAAPYPPGERPFTQYPASHSDGIARFDPATRQALFEAAEARLVADFVTYRSVAWPLD